MTSDADRGSKTYMRGNPTMRGAVLTTAEAGWGKYADGVGRWESLTRPAPPATEPNATGGRRLNPAFSEWMMGWPSGWVTDHGLNRTAELRIIGNGVVPQQALSALDQLLRETP